MEIEKRSFDIAAQILESDSKTVEGYACTFDRYLLFKYDNQEVYEQIDKNAFVGADLSDVIMQYNHDGKVFARTGNGTLETTIDDYGLKIRADLSKSTAAGELYEEIKAGLITKMSFAFDIREKSFDEDTNTRRILKIGKIYDVSAVSIPANDTTEIHTRLKELHATNTALELLKLKIKINTIL